MRFKFLLIVTIASMLGACNTNTKEVDNADEAVLDSCTYAYDAASTKLAWTAYKFTAKAGVSGVFNKFEVSPAVEQAGSVEELLNGMAFVLDHTSIFSGDEVRDPKIIKFFFGAMADSTIKGKLKNVKIADNKGTCEVELLMNGQTFSQLSNLALEGNTITLTTELDMNAWNAQNAVDALNEQCKELHTGEDGISILWPNISISVTSVLKTTGCDVSEDTASENM